MKNSLQCALEANVVARTKKRLSEYHGGYHHRDDIIDVDDSGWLPSNDDMKVHLNLSI